MSVAAKLAGSGDALTLVQFDGKLFVFSCARSFAPGTPLVLECDFGRSIRLELKCIGSTKSDDGGYRVRARAATLTREARAALDRTFGTAG